MRLDVDGRDRVELGLGDDRLSLGVLGAGSSTGVGSYNGGGGDDLLVVDDDVTFDGQNGYGCRVGLRGRL